MRGYCAAHGKGVHVHHQVAPASVGELHFRLGRGVPRCKGEEWPVVLCFLLCTAHVAVACCSSVRVLS